MSTANGYGASEFIVAVASLLRPSSIAISGKLASLVDIRHGSMCNLDEVTP